MSGALVLGVSALLQFLIGGLAWSIGRSAERRLFWVALALASLLMALREMGTCIQYFSTNGTNAPDLLMALLTLVVSLLLVGGLSGQLGRLVNLAPLHYALRESEARYRSLFEDSPISLWEVDLSAVKAYLEGLGVGTLSSRFADSPDLTRQCARVMCISEVNRATLRMFEAKDKEAFRDGLLQVLGIQGLNLFRDELLALIGGKTRFEGQTRMRTLAGSELSVIVRLSLARGHENSWTKVFVSVIDVSARMRATKELRRSEMRLRQLTENMPVMMNAFDKNGLIAFWNRECERVTGYSAEEVVGDAMAMELLYPDETVRERVVAERTESDDDYRGWEWALEARDGTRKTVAWSNISGRFPIPGWVSWGIGVDVTERKHAEVALRWYQRIVAATPDLVAVIGRDYRYQITNEAFQRAFEKSREEILGSTVAEIVGEKVFTGTIKPNIDRCLAGEIVNFQRWGDFVGLGRRYLSISYSPYHESDGVVSRAVAIFRDITTIRTAAEERETLITELEARNAEMERFTYTVSHDLKSPLITIQGFLGLLQRDIESGDERKINADISRIKKAASRMTMMLDELLDLSRVGRVISPPQDVDMSALVREALELVAGPLARRGVKVGIAPELPMLRGDRRRLLEVFQNLIENAVKFMGDQPEPRIEIGVLDEQEGAPVYYVRDNGMGIDARYHEKIFGLFERLDSDDDGTGIGLALVKRIIEMHDGRIWVESPGEGQGSRFCLTLPVAQGALAHGA